MITNWKIENFKSFCNESALEFGPLTIFAGPNSGGKSSFIQSVLIIAQTIAHKEGESDSITVDGIYANFGQFEEIKSTNGKDDRISISCICQPLSKHIQLSAEFDEKSLPDEEDDMELFDEVNSIADKIQWEMSFESNPTDRKKGIPSAPPKLVKSIVTCYDDLEDGNLEKSYISVNKANEKSNVGSDTKTKSNKTQNGSKFNVDLDEFSRKYIMRNHSSGKIHGCRLNHLFPKFVILKINSVQENAEVITNMLLNIPNYFGFYSREIENFDFSKEMLDEFREIFSSVELDFDKLVNENINKSKYSNESKRFSIHNWQELMKNLDQNRFNQISLVLKENKNIQNLVYKVLDDSISESKKNKHIDMIPGYKLTDSIDYLESFFKNSVKYLGPLRDIPRVIYQSPQETNSRNVGIRGEYTAAVFDTWKNLDIRYIKSKDYKNNTIEKEIVTDKLEVAIVDWLKYLEVGGSLNTNKREYGHELKVSVKNSKEKRHLTHVGVGVSQVLPILVLGLISEPDSTIIFEQPELHLHPKVQSLLGDFFHSLTLVNKQCILETHSEYLVDQVRLRIAESMSDDDPILKTKIYFMKYKSESSMTEYEEITYNEYGKLFHWPEGFFNQSPKLSQKIVTAAMKKSKLKKNTND